MLKLCIVAIALLGLVLTVNGQSGVRNSRCNNLPNGSGNVMSHGKMCHMCRDYYIYNIICKMRRTDGCVFEGALPKDCSRYVVCVNGMKMQFQCGEGTYYNNELQICVHPMDYPNLPVRQNCNYIIEKVRG